MTLAINSLHVQSQPPRADMPPSDRVPLWALQGSLDELVCIARTTSYGYALGLELAGETILLELQPNVERLAEKAARLEAWLLTQGWTSSTTE